MTDAVPLRSLATGLVLLMLQPYSRQLPDEPAAQPDTGAAAPGIEGDRHPLRRPREPVPSGRAP